MNLFDHEKEKEINFWRPVLHIVLRILFWVIRHPSIPQMFGHYLPGLQRKYRLVARFPCNWQHQSEILRQMLFSDPVYFLGLCTSKLQRRLMTPTSRKHNHHFITIFTGKWAPMLIFQKGSVIGAFCKTHRHWFPMGVESQDSVCMGLFLVEHIRKEKQMHENVNLQPSVK